MYILRCCPGLMQSLPSTKGCYSAWLRSLDCREGVLTLVHARRAVAVALHVCAAICSASARSLPSVAGVGAGADALAHPGAAPLEDYAALLASALFTGPQGHALRLVELLQGERPAHSAWGA